MRVPNDNMLPQLRPFRVLVLQATHIVVVHAHSRWSQSAAAAAAGSSTVLPPLLLLCCCTGDGFRAPCCCTDGFVISTGNKSTPTHANARNFIAEHASAWDPRLSTTHYCKPVPRYTVYLVPGVYTPRYSSTSTRVHGTYRYILGVPY